MLIFQLKMMQFCIIDVSLESVGFGSLTFYVDDDEYEYMNRHHI